MGEDKQKMNNKILIFVAIVVAAGVATMSSIYFPSPESPQQSLTYDDLNKLLQDDLATHDISMSSPIRLQSQETIEKYCSFFADERQQNLVQYCTSTELKDNNGKFLGNIHMVGSRESPQVIMVLIQANPLMSELNLVKTIFQTVINDTVCDCWADEKPSGITNLADWIDGLKQFHLSDTQPHSRSTHLKLGQKTIQLELTTNNEGYLWQLFIYS